MEKSNIPQLSRRERAMEMFLRNHGMVRRIVFRIVPVADLIDDLVDDVFVSYVENAERWDFNRDQRPLIKRIAVSIANQHWRDYSRGLPTRLAELFSYLRTAPSDDSRTIGFENQERELTALEHCKGRLAPKYRLLLEARYFEGISLEQVAEQNQIKPGTLRKIMCRIRESLRTCIERLLAEGEIHVE